MELSPKDLKNIKEIMNNVERCKDFKEKYSDQNTKFCLVEVNCCNIRIIWKLHTLVLF